jgi:ribosome-associated translation inhibitor RaiA
MTKKIESALIAIAIEGIVTEPVLRARFARRVRQAIARLRLAPTSARIDLTDQNGPKGGMAVRCAMTVRLPKRDTIHVEHVAQTSPTAFDGALDALERRLTRTRKQEREADRRPKKYYAAKRVLEAGEPKAGRRA